MRTKVKSYAKINLTLNITGTDGGFHNIESLMTTVDLYDTVTVNVKKREGITLKMRGLGEDLPTETNNAYKAARLFSEEYNSGGGIEVEIFKRIPLAGGLGGSSADAAGVLVALKKATGISDDIKPLADRLGSDTGYMTEGGFAVISGRGEKVRKIETDMTLHFVLVYAETGVNTGECYKRFDELGNGGVLTDTEKAVEALKTNDFDGLCKCVSNALTVPAVELNEEVKRNLEEVKSLSPSACGMTGSGSTVFGIYETEELCRWAIEKLKKRGLECEYARSTDSKKRHF